MQATFCPFSTQVIFSDSATLNAKGFRFPKDWYLSRWSFNTSCAWNMQYKNRQSKEKTRSLCAAAPKNKIFLRRKRYWRWSGCGASADGEKGGPARHDCWHGLSPSRVGISIIDSTEEQVYCILNGICHDLLGMLCSIRNFNWPSNAYRSAFLVLVGC